jgi:hypothetical protein
MDLTKEKVNLADIAFLQAYLIEMFEFEHNCEQSFKHTEWYLDQKFNEEEKEMYFSFLKERGAKCDCDVIKIIDLRKESHFNKLIHPK